MSCIFGRRIQDPGIFVFHKSGVFQHASAFRSVSRNPLWARQYTSNLGKPLFKMGAKSALTLILIRSGSITKT